MKTDELENPTEKFSDTGGSVKILLLHLLVYYKSIIATR